MNIGLAVCGWHGSVCVMLWHCSLSMDAHHKPPSWTLHALNPVIFLPASVAVPLHFQLCASHSLPSITMGAPIITTSLTAG